MAYRDKDESGLGLWKRLPLEELSRPVQDSHPANTAPKFPDQDPNTAGDQSDTAMRSVEENEKVENVGSEPMTLRR